MEVTRDDGAVFTMVVGTDTVRYDASIEPHCFAQIFDHARERDVDDLVWSAEADTPAELMEALDGNPILTLGQFRGPHAGPPPADERWLTDYAVTLFTQEMEAMRP